LNERIFMDGDPPRMLKLGQAAEWTLTGDGAFAHPFHIHVNPFEVLRQEPGADGKLTWAKVWKDTINLPSAGNPRPVVLRSRYKTFEGDFVIYCHILGHEDMGMMQRVRISK
jgi:FtsP/CotA-like multicopper oxidase with cupredoxin domain